MRKNRYTIVALIAVTIGAVILFAAIKRPIWFPVHAPSKDRPEESASGSPDRDHWFNIYLKNRKIGYANIQVHHEKDGLALTESIFMRSATLGDMIQNYQQKTEAVLNPDYSLRSFDYESKTGSFVFSVSGRFEPGLLDLAVMSAGTTTREKILAGPEIYLPPAVIPALARLKPRLGDAYAFAVFNPMDMAMDLVSAVPMRQERITVMEKPRDATRISIRSRLGLIQAWIESDGGIWSMFTGSDVRQTRTTRYNALFGLPAGEQTGTRPLAVHGDRPLPPPDTLKRLIVELEGSAVEFPDIPGGRQRMEGNRLIVEKESMDDLPRPGDSALSPEIMNQLMNETLYIQSGIAEIQQVAARIASMDDAPLARLRKIVDWVSRRMKKKSTGSLPANQPDGIARIGDCHDYAIITAALARAAGLPAYLETGIVYRDNEFQYHAWNRIYLGQWITCDAFLGQIPADVSHIRLASGLQIFYSDVFNRVADLGIKVAGYE